MNPNERLLTWRPLDWCRLEWDVYTLLLLWADRIGIDPSSSRKASIYLTGSPRIDTTILRTWTLLSTRIMLLTVAFSHLYHVPHKVLSFAFREDYCYDYCYDSLLFILPPSTRAFLWMVWGTNSNNNGSLVPLRTDEVHLIDCQSRCCSWLSCWSRKDGSHSVYWCKCRREHPPFRNTTVEQVVRLILLVRVKYIYSSQLFLTVCLSFCNIPTSILTHLYVL